METTTMTNGQVRRVRDEARVTQTAVAKELGISRYSYSLFELHHVPLPRDITPSDVLDAIERIKRQRRDTNPDQG